MIGLGRMGMNMTRRLLQGDHEVVAFNRTPDKTKQISSEGAESAFTLEELVNKLETPRIVWIMLPAGKIVDDHIEQLTALLEPGDIIVEGGNSRYTDDIRREKELRDKNIHYLPA
jgi:6-phosphogluconate dehydrogenase